MAVLSYGGCKVQCMAVVRYGSCKVYSGTAFCLASHAFVVTTTCSDSVLCQEWYHHTHQNVGSEVLRTKCNSLCCSQCLYVCVIVIPRTGRVTTPLLCMSVPLSGLPDLWLTWPSSLHLSYNNEWMVVDYKLFTKGEKNLQDNLLWVLEQIPWVDPLESVCVWWREPTRCNSPSMNRWTLWVFMYLGVWVSGCGGEGVNVLGCTYHSVSMLSLWSAPQKQRRKCASPPH